MINLNLLKSANFSRIKFGGGIVGKTSNVSISLLIIIGIIAYNKIENEWAILALLLMMALLFVFYLVKILSFAEKNPEIAVLEGMELIKYKEVGLAAKGLPNPESNKNNVDNPCKLEKGLKINDSEPKL